MKKYQTYTNGFLRIKALIVLLLIFVFSACNEDILDERPLDFLSPDVTLTNKVGFETAIYSIHAGVRDYFTVNDGVANTFFAYHPGTDIALRNSPDWRDYEVYLTPTLNTVDYFWEFVYTKILPRANIVIDYADRPQAVWASEAEKNAIVAEARFFRAYGHNVLANLYGGVPIVDQVYNQPKLDFVRSSREEVLAFAAADLEYASQWLPATTTQPGRIVKAAADHLLAEVYISLGRYDDAIASANRVINDGIHALMTQRFGRYANQPGDVYSDLFKDFNQNLAANTETIWALQTEFQTPGGGLYRGVRYWNPNFPAVRDPEGQPALQFVDSTNRPQGFLRGTYHAYTGVWMSDWNDMRNSKYNIRRVWQYNLPSSNFYGQIVDPTTAVNVDTLANFFPFIRKVEGEAFAGAFSGFVHKDIYMMRLAETYLLRAEAYLLKGDLTNAVNDVNVIRSRANATPATVAEMSMDYILDERIRELLVEEPRRLTLARTNTLVDRVRRFNPFSQGNIKDYHRFFPIPQKAIDANINATLEQNPGYF